MKKFAKYFAVLLLVVIIAAAAFVATFDVNQYKAKIETVAADSIGRPFSIGGDITLGLQAWHPSVILHDVLVGTKKDEGRISASKIEVMAPLSRDSYKLPLNLDTKISNLRIGERELGDFSFPLTITENGVSTDLLNGRKGAARMSGKASYLDGKLNLDIEVTKLDYADITPDFSGEAVDVSISVQSRGKTGAQITKNMNGTVMLVGGKGAMSGKGLDLWGADLLSNLLFSHGDTTTINCTIADIGLENGVAVFRVLVLDTDRVALFGKGGVNLMDDTVSMKLRPKPKSRAIINLATPMKIGGKIGALTVTPDAKHVMTKIGGVLLSTVNPAAALVPYVLQSTAKKNACAEYLQTGTEGQE
ncbi:MAG: AsmA family protein [Alphaproteobacteria bacterium]|nr:AsmA family protein [Alphaproteobacteria bacterium]